MPFIFLSVACFAQKLPAWKMRDYTNYVQNNKSEVLVINFWATYCKPCVAEMPGLIEIAKNWPKDKVNLVFVSLDLKEQYPKGILAFMRKRKIANEMFWLNETDANYFCPMVDSAWSGTIPATVIINSKTGYKKLIEDEILQTQFEHEIKIALQPKAN